MSSFFFLEIGSYEGRSACYLIERFASQYPIELHCIDTWTGSAEHDRSAMHLVEARFDRNVSLAISHAANKVQVHKYKGSSVNVLAGLLTAGKQGQFDFIYVDGSHEAPDVLADAVLAFQLLKVGRLVAFDDYLWSAEQTTKRNPLHMPKLAIDAFLNLSMRRLNIVRGQLLDQIYAVKRAE